jgi:vacuolar-type H+-ATPase subunit F/Vma7
MKKIVFITPFEACFGFALAGAVHHTTAPEGAEVLLRRVLADPDTGVAVVDERLAMAIDEELFREMERRWFGILLVLPSSEATGGETAEDYAQRLIRQAIGYRVRLQS